MNRNRKLNRSLYWALPLIGTLLLSACSEKKNNTTTSTLVKTAIVKPWLTNQPITYPGKIKASADVKLAFRVAGPIHRFNVEEGQFVKKGQLIAEIDPRDYKIQLAATKAEYKQIKAEAERVIELHKRNSVSANDYDKAVSGLNRIKAKLDAHQNALKDTRLIAPYDGFIQEKFFDTHETVSAGLPIVSMINTNWYEVEIDIPAADYVRKDEFADFKCETEVFPNVQFPLKMLEIKQKSNLNQLYKVRFKLEKQANYNLAAGMSVNVNINFLPKETALLSIPISAIIHKDEQPQVYIYQAQTGTLQQRAIQINELLKDGSAIIKGALKPGEQVVSAGVHTLKEGQKVELLKPVSSTNVGGLL
ncbi:MAG: efflux RND transporter periplasmic adaptor subunit [Marinilabiliaceae bacterium]|nr:efflux RND transporter periplasmic adaptor subunit [Marinilabiliaceae bacterium]